MPIRGSNFGLAFDRETIRSKIQKLSFEEARNKQGPLYDVLLQKLLESSCTTTARHFDCLAKREAKLLAKRVIKERVSDEPEFLIRFVDYFKLAEQSFKMKNGNGVLAALKLLYQGLMLGEIYREKFSWMLVNVYDIVIEKVKDLDEEEHCYSEIKMRLFFKYGCNIQTTGERLDRAILYFEKAFELAKGELWEPDSNPDMKKYKTMYEAIPQRLAYVLLAQAKRINQSNPDLAWIYASKAVRFLSAVSWDDNKLLACQTIISKVWFMMERKKYNPALALIRKVQQHIFLEAKNSEFFRLICTVFWYRGDCFYNLNDLPKALESLRAGYKHSRLYKFRDLQAEFLLSIGRTFGKKPKKINIAMSAYSAARLIFHELNDEKNRIKTTYLMAKLNADKLFPKFLGLIKSKEYCKYYDLRQWKNLCTPFWQKEKNVGSTSLFNFLPETMIVNSRVMKQFDSDEKEKGDNSEHAKRMLDGEGMEGTGSTKSTSNSALLSVISAPFENGYDDNEYNEDFFRSKENLLKSNWVKDSADDLESTYKTPINRDNLDCLLKDFEDYNLRPL